MGTEGIVVVSGGETGIRSIQDVFPASGNPPLSANSLAPRGNGCRLAEPTPVVEPRFSSSSLPRNNDCPKWGNRVFLAERQGFEPWIPFWGIHDFQSCSFGQLGHLSLCMAVRVSPQRVNSIQHYLRLAPRIFTTCEGNCGLARYSPAPSVVPSVVPSPSPATSAPASSSPAPSPVPSPAPSTSVSPYSDASAASMSTS